MGSPWVGPHQVVRQATGHTVGIQRSVDKPIIFVHVDDLKLCPGPQEISWTPNVSTAKSLCASTVAFRPGSDIGEVTPDPSVDVSAWGDEIDLHQDSIVQKDLDRPIAQRELIYQDCKFQSIAHLLCYRYAISVSDVLIGVRVAVSSDRLTACRWLNTKGEATHDTRHARR